MDKSQYRINFEKGKEAYERSKLDSTSLELNTSSLKAAFRFYNLAVQSAENNEELCDAHLNCSTVSFEILKLFPQNEPSSNLSPCQFYMANFLQSISKALELGKLCSKASTWIAEVKETAQSAVFYFLIHLNKQPLEVFSSSINKLAEETNDQIKIEMYFMIAGYFFSESVSQLHIENIDKSWLFINECQIYTEKCRKILRENKQNTEFEFSNLEDLNKLTEEFNLHFSLVDARKCKQEADKFAERFINNEKISDDGQVWETIDLYRMAVTRIIGKNVLLEAEILSIIGLIYDQMDLKDLAKSSFNACMDLCKTLEVESLSNYEWFTVCEKALERLNKETIVQELEEREDLESDSLPDVTNRRCSSDRFLRHVTKTAPATSIENDKLLKKMLNKRAVRIYELFETEKCFVNVIHTIIHVRGTFY
jgi:hypothetical protein